jgi:hypothetical protein
MLKTAIATVVFFMVSIELSAAARAAGPQVQAGCAVTESTCDVGVQTTATGAPSSPAPLKPAGSGGQRTCTIPGVAGTVDCVDPEWGTLANDGCYYKPVGPDFTPPPALASSVQPGVAGSWYEQQCLTISTGSGVVWEPDGAVAGLIPVDPAVIARRAAAELRPPAPAVGTSPALAAGTQVGLPVWLWISSAGWRPVSATAAVPGVSVTATATPVSVTWDFGAAGHVTCQGPGTPFRPGADDPAAASPTCGITMSRPGRWPVTVTETWRVSWAGAGQGGALPNLTTGTAAALVVGETEALVGSGGVR